MRIQFAGLTREMRFDTRDRIVEQTERWQEGSTPRSASGKASMTRKGSSLKASTGWVTRHNWPTTG